MRAAGGVLPAVVACSFACSLICSLAQGAVELPLGDAAAPIAIRGDGATHWQQGAYEVWVLRGNVQVQQKDIVARGHEAVLWIDRAEAFSGRPSKVIAYLEGNVDVDFGSGSDPFALGGGTARLHDKTWLGRFHTTAGIEMSIPLPMEASGAKPAIFDRGTRAHAAGGSSSVQQAQFTAEEIAPPATGQAAATGGRRVRFFPRNSGRFQPRLMENPNNPNEQVWMITGGVQIVVDGIDQLGTVTLETDNVIVWTPKLDTRNRDFAKQFQADDAPVEFYLEGNIVFRQGDRVIFAKRMYYNVRQEYGVVLSAEMLTPVPQYQGMLRLKADVLQQVNRQQFQAYGAALTSSRIGVPRYWLQSENLSFTDNQVPLTDPFTNQPALDPLTGLPQIAHSRLATARNNYIYMAGVPVFYWPTLATDLTTPNYYIDQVAIKSDRIIGTALMVDFNMYQLLGIQNHPPQNKWLLSSDYLSQRGPALGTHYQYQGDSFLGLPGPNTGFIDAWGIHDTSGFDNLGLDRRMDPFYDSFRGRVLANHRQQLPNDFQLTAEVGLISDRNFMEQYFEKEFDTFKSQTTGVELKQLLGNSSWSVTADVQATDFFTRTQWLPRLDHFTMGQPLLFDRLTWHEHTNIGYADMQVAAYPQSPVDQAKFSFFPWEANVHGTRAATRHELDLPLDAGPVKVVPYVLGEAAYFGSDLGGNDVTRLFGQAGVRASLPMWRSDPTVQSELFNLNGMAHKIVFEAEALIADANQDVSTLPLYDAIDDDAQLQFRRRLVENTFGLPPGSQVPLRFDPRYFAIRSNLQGSVASPSTELADDLAEVRLGIKQRWQTKRGLPGQERIIDWVVFDVDATLFPNPNRDNFGETIGLINYDFQWHVGDRLTILSDGFADTFADGLRQMTVGGLISRPEQGSFYLGYRSTDGPFTASVLTSSLNYRMSEKWIATASTNVVLSGSGNVYENISLTRVGESFLIRLGFNYDASRNNLGAVIGFEPRFLPSSQSGRVGGVNIPPAGTLGLE
jgi:lipopolysaccharide export system protein LptA